MQRLLIANRGEIARRIIRTARAMGIATVAVHAEPDARALHVGEADAAVALGGAASADSYLRIDKLIAAARASGADAVHPGYGFLSENADFAQAVLDAGLLWVGPPPQAIRALGSKSAVKQLAAQVGVPCLAGYHGEDQRDERFAQEAARIGWPVMVKAVAGGGGRGMRLVRSADALPAALASARAEARAAFGSDALLLERALTDARHVEVQLLADAHGHIVHLGERDCSLQRRNQKLIEESPSPAVDAALRERLGQAAVALARAGGYVGAGTVEFLLEEKDLSAAGPPQGAKAPSVGSAAPEMAIVGANFFLMEMNTRLQVEHPVTEALTGLDLVEWQLRIARGEALGFAQHEVRLQGHAIEARLCAEDEHFIPQAGRVLHWRAPEGLRVDHALADGCEVPPHYDSLLAKLIVHAPTRAEACARLAAALERTELLGIASNRRLLAACLRDTAFQAGQARVPFLAEQAPRLREALQKEELLWQIPCALAAIFPHKSGEALAQPFRRPLRIEHRGARLDLPVHDAEVAARRAPGAVCAQLPDGRWHVQAGGVDLLLRDASHDAPAAARAAADDAVLRSPLAGTLIALQAAPGDAVRAGQTLAVVESMKLEHTLAAPRAGRVAAVAVHAGQQVAAGQVLVTLAAPEAVA